MLNGFIELITTDSKGRKVTINCRSIVGIVEGDNGPSTGPTVIHTRGGYGYTVRQSYDRVLEMVDQALARI